LAGASRRRSESKDETETASIMFCRSGIPRHCVYAEKVTFQQESRLFKAEKVAFELKSHLFVVHILLNKSQDQDPSNKDRPIDCQ
jgi:hypothetical protein